ncbi:PQQ-binding-like beta-propeller repeat protein [Candidatus Bipolaricaulota bacterium]|nr:PQQ-binding-like beta-propeller repeat protein [Candidatus Bipolaricaulota bacterium]
MRFNRNLILFLLIFAFSCAHPLPIYADSEQDVPWPLAWGNAGNSGYSPYSGIVDPWFVPVIDTYELEFDLNYGQTALDQFILVGKDGSLLVPSRYGGGKHFLTAIDPETAEVLWSYTVARWGNWFPSIGPRGNIYLYDQYGFPAILSPEGQAILHPELGSYTVVSPRVNTGRTIPGKEVVYWLNAHYTFSHKNQITDPKAIHGINQRLTDTPWVTLYDAALGDGGSLYILSTPRKESSEDELNITLSGYTPGLREKFTTVLSQNSRLTSNIPFLLVDDNRLAYVLIGATGMPWKDVKGDPLRIVAVNLSTGRKVWTHELYPETYSGLSYTRPVVGRDGTVYALFADEVGLKLRAINRKSGDRKWEIMIESWGPEGKSKLTSGSPPVSTHRSMLAAADGKLYVEYSGGIKIVHPRAGEIDCVLCLKGCRPNVGKDVKAMAMAADGTLYFATSRTIMKTVPDQDPRIVSFTPTLGSYIKNTDKIRVGFNGKVIDPLGWNRKLIFKWDQGDGTTSTNEWITYEDEGVYSRDINHSHNYQPATGTPPVKLTVRTDGCSRPSTTAETVLCLEEPEIIDITATPVQAYTGETEVELSCDARAPGGFGEESLNYQWRLGDGTTLNGKTVNYTYSEAGKYQVSVSVSVGNSPFTAESTKNVTVKNFPDIQPIVEPKQFTAHGVAYELSCPVFDPFGNEVNVEWSVGPEPLWNERTVTLQPGETYAVTANVTVKGREEINKSKTITVNPAPPTFQLVTDRTEGPTPLDLELSCTTQPYPAAAGAFEYSWNVQPSDGEGTANYVWKGEATQGQERSISIFDPGSYSIGVEVEQSNEILAQPEVEVTVNGPSLSLNEEGIVLSSDGSIFMDEELDPDGDGLNQYWEDAAMELVNPVIKLDEEENWLNYELINRLFTTTNDIALSGQDILDTGCNQIHNASNESIQDILEFTSNSTSWAQAQATREAMQAGLDTAEEVLEYISLYYPSIRVQLTAEIVEALIDQIEPYYAQWTLVQLIRVAASAGYITVTGVDNYYRAICALDSFLLSSISQLASSADYSEHHVVNFVRVTPWPSIEEPQYVLFYYCIAWTMDYGRFSVLAHRGDAERVIMAWKVEDENTLNLEWVFTSSHRDPNAHHAVWHATDMTCNRGYVANLSEETERSELMKTELQFDNQGNVILAASEDKHALYPSCDICEEVTLVDVPDRALDYAATSPYLAMYQAATGGVEERGHLNIGEDCCGGGSWRFPVFNVGEPDHHLIDDLDDPPYPGLQGIFPGETVWSGNKANPDYGFCGGLTELPAPYRAKNAGPSSRPGKKLGTEGPPNLLEKKLNGRFRITVETGDIKGAGTDANVYIASFGRIPTGGPRPPEEFELIGTFDRGDTDVINLGENELPQLLGLRHIRVKHDNSGKDPGWYIHRLVIEDKETGEEWEFVIDRWLAEDQVDGETQADFEPTAYCGKAEYEIEVTTSDLDWKTGEGTDANVYISLFGTNSFGKKCSSGEFLLDNKWENDFETGDTNTFHVTGGEIGELTHITLRHDGALPLSDWHCDQVIVRNNDTDQEWTIPVDRWLQESESGLKPFATLYPAENTS